MFGLFRSMFANYRIVKVQDGFIAEYRDGIYGWECLKHNGTASLPRHLISDFRRDYICGTEDEAGERVNRHSGLSNGEVVWSR